MSSATRPAALVLLVLAAAATTAQAAVQCPASIAGHPLRAVDGGGLYQGPVEKNMLLAPETTRQGPGGWVNTWTFRDPADGVTLVCSYEGTRAVQRIRLTPETKSCRQDARSFVCQ